jgi:hypothetical protein
MKPGFVGNTYDYKLAEPASPKEQPKHPLTYELQLQKPTQPKK